MREAWVKVLRIQKAEIRLFEPAHETFTGLDKQILSVKLLIFSYPSILTYVLGTQKNRLTETVLLSTHNILFGCEIRKLFFCYAHGLSYLLDMGAAKAKTSMCICSVLPDDVHK